MSRKFVDEVVTHSPQPSPRGRGRWFIGLALLLLLACASTGYRELSGVLVDVRSREITHADSIILRDDAGSLHTLGVSPDVANHPEHPTTAAHLRQHMAGGDRMVVRYRETGDGPVAIEVFHPR